MPDGYVLIRFGVNDVVGVDINEEVVATEEICTQNWATDIS